MIGLLILGIAAVAVAAVALYAALSGAEEDCDDNFSDEDVGSPSRSCSGDSTATPNEPALRGQEEPMSCGMAATGMVIETVTGDDVPESELRTESANHPNAYDPVNGTGMGNLTDLLQDHGVDDASEPQSGQTIDDLQEATAGGNPAIVHVNNPGGGGHFMVVDGVRTNDDGSRTIIVRDPLPVGSGTRREMTEDEFNARGFSGWVITTND